MEGPIFKELNEIPELDDNWVNQYIKENYVYSLNEMARVNVKEFAGYFPCNKFNIKIWLDNKSAINKKLTNTESAQFLWDSNNN